jgi:hypothetical protein
MNVTYYYYIIIFTFVVDKHLLELLNSVKVNLPKAEQSYEINEINEEMEHLNINGDFFWFQQNSRNVYKMCINEGNWQLIDNKDNYTLSEMYRICQIGPEEALITGGIQGFLCSNLTMHFKKGNFKKKQNMFYERRTHATCKSGDFIFVCGGINPKGEPMNACEKYSLEYEKWIKISHMVVGKELFINYFKFS